MRLPGFAHCPLQSNSPVQPQNNRGNTENKQAEKGSWLKQVGEGSRVEKVKSDRQGVGGGDIKNIKMKTISGKVKGTNRGSKKDKITYVDKPTTRVRLGVG